MPPKPRPVAGGLLYHALNRGPGAEADPGSLGSTKERPMTDQQMFARWKKLLGDTSEIPWTAPEYMVGFFQGFRPHGDGLAAAFEGVVGADEILPRLMEVYPVAA